MKNAFAAIGRPPSRPFRPDLFQTDALAAVTQGDCIVIAPTGSGKTWIAQQAMQSVLDRGGRCWYASPLKALSNAKWVEFGQIFSLEKVGILTGDTKENAEAPIVVGTTEILRNQLYDAMSQGQDLSYDLVILDEAHFLGDRERGVVWEEVLIYLPARIHLLLLSATIGNGDEIACWLQTLRNKPCPVVRENRRPVPLFPLCLHPSGVLTPLLLKHRLNPNIDENLRPRRSRLFRRQEQVPFPDVMDLLQRHNLLPAIFFLKSRSDCNAALKACRPSEMPLSPRFHEDLGVLLDRFPYLRNHQHLHALREVRIAAHHAGQLPAWKFLVETMMKKGHLHGIFATATVAAGVNYPARTIVLLNSDTFNGHDFQPLTGIAFHQMTGRAGRRGLDEIGFLLCLPGRFMDLGHVRDLLFRKPEDVESQLRNDFSMVLNLLLSQSVEDIRSIFTRSLAVFQRRRGYRPPQETRKGGLWKEFLRHLNFLKLEGFVDGMDRLTADGIWASQLRLDQPLLIAELLRHNVLPDHDGAVLAALIAPFVYDGDDSDAMEKVRLPRLLNMSWKRMNAALEPLVRRLNQAGFPVPSLLFWVAVAIYHWAKGKTWEHTIMQTGLAEGDLAMLILRTADNLRQIASLKESHPGVASLAVKAREAILREPVILE